MAEWVPGEELTKVELTEIGFNTATIAATYSAPYGLLKFHKQEFHTVLVTLEKKMAAYCGSDTIRTVRWPRDWWQAVKERFFPKWLLRRFPVMYKERVFQASLMLPKIVIPKQNLEGSFFNITEITDG